MDRKAIARLFYARCFPAAQRGPRSAGAASAGVDTQLPHASGPTCRAAAPQRGLRSYRRDLPQSCFISRPPEPHEAVGHSWEGDIFFPPLFAFVCRDPFAKIILEMLLKKKEGGKEKRARKQARMEGRALSISAQLRSLPQSEMEANNALKLLFRAVQSARLVRRGCSALHWSARREGHGFTAPNPSLPRAAGHPPRGRHQSGAPRTLPAAPGPLRGEQGQTGSMRFGGGRGSVQLHPMDVAPWGWPLSSFFAPGEVAAHPPCHPPACALCWHTDGGCWGLPGSKRCIHGDPSSVRQARCSPIGT